MFNRRTILLGLFLLFSAKSALSSSAFTTLDDQEKNLEYPAVVNFWATWCAPCIKELPDLETLGQKLGSKATVYLVNFGETSKTIEAFQSKRPELFGPHTQMLKDSSMSGLKAYGLRGVPTTVLINSQGEVVESIQGLKAWGDDAVVSEISAKIVTE
mgnify:FL=1